MTQRLHFDRFDGPENNPPLIIAHGLFGSGRNWRGLARRYSDARTVITVDMRNHGASFWDDLHDYPAMAGDLAQIAGMFDQPADILGHSMGGKAAMVLALTQPALVNRLIVADIAPKSYTHSYDDLISQLLAMPLAGFSRRGEVESAMERFVSDAAERAFFAQAVRFDDAAPSWVLNLNVLQREMPKIVGFPDIGAAVFRGPSCFIRGGNSRYVQEGDFSKIATHFPDHQIKTIEGAGHWLHAENPRAFSDALLAFLNGG